MFHFPRLGALHKPLREPPGAAISSNNISGGNLTEEVTMRLKQRLAHGQTFILYNRMFGEMYSLLIQVSRTGLHIHLQTQAPNSMQQSCHKNLHQTSETKTPETKTSLGSLRNPTCKL